MKQQNSKHSSTHTNMIACDANYRFSGPCLSIYIPPKIRERPPYLQYAEIHLINPPSTHVPPSFTYKQLQTTELAPLLDKKKLFSPTYLDDLSKAADHPSVVGDRVELDASLHHIHRTQSAVRDAAADASGQTSLEEVSKVKRSLRRLSHGAVGMASSMK